MDGIAIDSRIGEIDELGMHAADEIRRRIIGISGKLGVHFPRMKFALARGQNFFYEEGFGVELYNAGKFWGENEAVVLTHEGIFLCRFVYASPCDAQKFTQQGEALIFDGCLDWASRIEEPYLYIKFGTVAMRKLIALESELST